MTKIVSAEEGDGLGVLVTLHNMHNISCDNAMQVLFVVIRSDNTKLPPSSSTAEDRVVHLPARTRSTL